MKIPQKDIPLRVLIYLEDGEFVAHLLEMDLVGTGQTAVEAQKELHDAFEAQITFLSPEQRGPVPACPPEALQYMGRASISVLADQNRSRVPRTQRPFGNLH